MATEQLKDTSQNASPVTRTLRSALLQKQPEIEEENEDTSPGSDQSDTTITAEPIKTCEESPEVQLQSSDDFISNKHNYISPKIKQLTRSEAVCEECASPPLDPFKSTARTCSTDSSSSGIGTKSSITSGSMCGSSFHSQLDKNGSQCSEVGTSFSLSRDSSVDTPYKDSTGTDLEDFIKKTLNKTPKDRSMLIKLEVDLIKFIHEPKHHYLKFTQMSSYDRMLVHRIAAFFGLDHNVDQTGKCVIVNKTQNTRIPDFSFQDHVAYGDESKPKMLLRRGVGGSFDELAARSLQKPTLDSTRAAKSLEERQQMYQEARSRIFTGDELEEGQPTGYPEDDSKITTMVKMLDKPTGLSSREDNPWSVPDSAGYGMDCSGKAVRMLVPKANSFGGTGTFVLQQFKSPLRGSSLSKAGPSMTPGGLKVFLVASDLNSIPPGSVMINPQTGQPFLNPDGTLYRYIPGQPLPTAVPNFVTKPQQQSLCPVQPDWASHHNQDGQSCQEMTQQLALMKLTPQSSTENTGCGDSIQTVVGAQPQSVYFQGSQVVPVQQPLRYSCTMNCAVPNQVEHMAQGYFGPSHTVPIEGNNPAQQYPNYQYCQQYVQPGYHGNYMYSMTTQGQPLLGQGQCCDMNYISAYDMTSPLDHQTSNFSGFGYPESGFQQKTHTTPNQSNIYYAVQSPQSNSVILPGQQGYTFSGQQGTSYQASSPSQHTTVTSNVQLNSVAAQPVNMVSNMNSLNVTPQQSLGTVVQGFGGVVGSLQGAPYVPTYQSVSHTLPPNPQFSHVTPSFSSPIHTISPHVVPYQGVQAPSSQIPTAQTFHTMYRSSVQMPLQLHNSQAQKPMMITSSTCKSSRPPTPHSHVTVSAKGLSSEANTALGKVENGSGESADAGSNRQRFVPQVSSLRGTDKSGLAIGNIL